MSSVFVCSCRAFCRAHYLVGLQGRRERRTPAVPEDGNPVYISKALFHDRDSVMYYFEQGLMHDDPKGLFVLGVAAHLRQDGTLPEEIYAPSLEEGDNYLLQSANRGYTDAIQAIYCLYHHGCWSLELPEVSHNK